MKVATWNVNRIRAREVQLCEWLERDHPDIVFAGAQGEPVGYGPLQAPRLPRVLAQDARVLGSVSPHQEGLLNVDPAFSHPPFDAGGADRQKPISAPWWWLLCTYLTAGRTIPPSSGF
jgi:hypothetical protein